MTIILMIVIVFVIVAKNDNDAELIDMENFCCPQSLTLEAVKSNKKTAFKKIRTHIFWQ